MRYYPGIDEQDGRERGCGRVCVCGAAWQSHIPPPESQSTGEGGGGSLGRRRMA